jgi:hypothetical protein
MVQFSLTHSCLITFISWFSPPQANPYEWQDSAEEARAREMMTLKQQSKERDGFCRRVDLYDGQILTVDGT